MSQVTHEIRFRFRRVCRRELLGPSLAEGKLLGTQEQSLSRAEQGREPKHMTSIFISVVSAWLPSLPLHSPNPSLLLLTLQPHLAVEGAWLPSRLVVLYAWKEHNLIYMFILRELPQFVAFLCLSDLLLTCRLAQAR